MITHKRHSLFPLWWLMTALAVMTGCADRPDSNAETDDSDGDILETPKFVVEPESIDFGGVLIGETASRSLTLKNVGDADLFIGSLSFEANGSGVFGLDTSSELTIPPDAFVTLDVTFAPVESREYGATLELASNDEELPIARVALSGYGCTDADHDGTSDCSDDDGDGYAEDEGDCDDSNPEQNPGETELCNLLDDDCDGEIDEGSDFDGDGDGFTSCSGDCDDDNAAVYPDAEEVCNGFDDDCDGVIDEGYDTDGDGYTSCQSPVADCDDVDENVYPGADEACNAVDDDCDGQIDEDFDADGDSYTTCGGDCNDSDGSIHPDADEVCNNIDDNCNGEIDEGTEFDSDGDGLSKCDGDCDDDDPAVHPGADETCNGIDDDCDGAVDEDLPTNTWYEDGDGDLYGRDDQTLVLCSQPEGYVTAGGDCDDSDPAVHPGADEVCNGIDDDCDGAVDEGFDGDGIGGADCIDDDGDGYSEEEGDCDDGNPQTYPGAEELCDEQDNDCDGTVDEDSTAFTFYADVDGDGYGDPDNLTTGCAAPQGYVSDDTDCDDGDSSVHPGADEVCNGIDDDCDGLTDEGVTMTWYPDADGDGYGDASSAGEVSCTGTSGTTTDSTDCNDGNGDVHPGADEKCNGIDDDCDGQVDEGYGDCNDSDDDGDGWTENEGDCDDTDLEIRPVHVDGTWAGEETGAYDTPFNSIQEGIDAADDCPLILVEPYTYQERIDFSGKRITLRSTQGAAETIIDGGSAGSVVTITGTGSDGAELDGFTIQGGFAEQGGGIYIENASPIIRNSVIEDNEVTAGGGGVYAKNGAPYFYDNTIRDNLGPTSTDAPARAGGGILLEGASATLQGNLFEGNIHVYGGALALYYGSDAVIGGFGSGEGNTFSGNRADDQATSDGANGVGGAIFVLNSSPEITGDTFESNWASGAGGALYLYGTSDVSDSKVLVDGCDFQMNTTGNVDIDTATRGIGGALLSSNATLELRDSVFTDNQAAVFGGAVYLRSNTQFTLSDSRFASNSVSHGGGAGGAVYIASAFGEINDSVFESNDAVYGGALLVKRSDNTGSLPADVDILGSIFEANTAWSGGALYMEESNGSVSANSFQYNEASGNGGAFIVDSSNTEVIWNDILGNEAGDQGGAIYIPPSTDDSAWPTVSNNLIRYNTAATDGGGLCLDEASGDQVAAAALINNVVVGNTAPNNGAGAYLGADADVDIQNNIFYDNRGGHGIYAKSSSAQETVLYNDSFGNAKADFGGTLESHDPSNLSVDPSFVSYSGDSMSTNDDFHLTADSPVKDAGNPSSEYNDADGTRNDMGAYGGPDGEW